MISLILTILYLAKDTVHRWFSRISSPIARVLVVYFLTLSALAALGSFVITLSVVRKELVNRGADIVVGTMSSSDGRPLYVPTQKEIDEVLDAESYVLKLVGSVSLPGGRSVHVYTYPFQRTSQMMPLLAAGRPTLLQLADSRVLPPGPGDVYMQKQCIPVVVKDLAPGHTLSRIVSNAALLVPPDMVKRVLPDRNGGTLHNIVLRVRDIQTSESITRAERYLQLLERYENALGSIVSAASLLSRMDDILSKQTQCRIALCLGICVIVGILLTALAGMEYRQNEYIYTLMKSFGIHPLMLVGAFIAENLFIVFASFTGAVVTFMYFQHFIVTEILKLEVHSLSLQDIMPEIRLISFSLLGCVLLSAVPIFAAANREIGRVLK